MLQLLQEDKMVYASEIQTEQHEALSVYLIHLAVILELTMLIK